jgi:hypothetical protein
VAEGYGRRTLPEYPQYLCTAKGPLAETLTRACGLRRVALISADDFEALDGLHYEIENKLIRLIGALEAKRDSHEWRDTIPTQLSKQTIPQQTAAPSPEHPANPPNHRSNDRFIQ